MRIARHDIYISLSDKRYRHYGVNIIQDRSAHSHDRYRRLNKTHKYKLLSQMLPHILDTVKYPHVK